MPTKGGLSPFQKEKLEYYFKFFDTDGDGFIDDNDLPRFMDKILNFTGWEKNSGVARELYEVHESFFETLREKADQDNDRKIELHEWMALWENILPGCMGMHNFPVWLRLLPKSLFRIIDTKENGVLDAEEMQVFYEKFVNLPTDEAEKISKRAFNDMTDYGRYPLDIDGYEQIFANFLLGRTPHGPGRFIFGCFEHEIEGKKFTLISGPPPDDDEEEINRQRLNQRRRSSETPRFRLVWRKQ